MAISAIDAAKRFIRDFSARRRSFLDREHELHAKLTELDAKKSAFIADYSPDSPFDSKAAAKIDDEIAGIQTELSVLMAAKDKTPKLDPEKTANHADKVRKSTLASIEQKKLEIQKTLTDILAAKKALLAAQAKHNALSREIESDVLDANELIGQLTYDLARQAQEKREQAHVLGLQISREVGDGSISLDSPRSNQPLIDELTVKMDELRREASHLDEKAKKITAGIPTIESYLDEKGNKTYYVSEKEQNKASHGLTW